MTGFICLIDDSIHRLFLEKRQTGKSDSAHIFRINLTSEPPTLDGSLATDNISIPVIKNLMEGLAEYDSALPKPASEYSYFLYDIENVAEYNTGQLSDPDKVGVRALNAVRLQVKLKKQAVYFPSMTTFTASFPQQQDLIEPHGKKDQ